MPDENDGPTQDDPANLRGLLRDAQRERDRYKDEAAEGTEAKRMLAIYQAGVTDPLTVKLLTKVHEGEWDADAIKATVATYRLGATSEAPGNNEPDPREEAAQQLAAVASGQRGTSDTRKPSANDDEALQEDLLALMQEHIPTKGRVIDKDAYMRKLEGIYAKYQIRTS